MKEELGEYCCIIEVSVSSIIKFCKFERLPIWASEAAETEAEFGDDVIGIVCEFDVATEFGETETVENEAAEDDLRLVLMFKVKNSTVIEFVNTAAAMFVTFVSLVIVSLISFDGTTKRRCG